MNFDRLREHGLTLIVAFGDSVIYGAVGPDEISYETVYWNRLRRKISALRNDVPVNAIHAGSGGVTAAASLARMERDVFSHHPDLVIVCFGLNDVNGPLGEYTDALAAIFDACRQRGVAAIFMTPNMLNTYVTEDTPAELRDYAAKTAAMQNDGTMDTHMQAACRTAREHGIPVCDGYALRKQRSRTEDATRLLANGISHPRAELHELFAQELFRMLFPESTPETSGESTRWRA